MINLHSGYVFGKYISEGKLPKPLPANVYFDNGVFNSLYVPSGFNPLNNKQLIEHDPPYQPSYLDYYSIIDYNIDDFTYPNGSLNNGTSFDFIIHGGTTFEQDGVEFTSTTIKMRNKRGRYYDAYQNSNSACFTGIIFPIKNFVSFLNKTPYNIRAIYVRYKVSEYVKPDKQDWMNALNPKFHIEIGYKDSETTMVLKHGDSSSWLSHDLNQWYTSRVWRSDNIDYEDNKQYYLDIGLGTGIKSRFGDVSITVEIDKIWSDEYT